MHSYTSLQQRVSEEFRNARFLFHPEGLYLPIHYTMENGGKRLRPVLVLLSCDLCRGDIGQAILPAMGLEIFHNFTLLHDDIMDQADLRRGRETVHRKWNVNTAILSGDTMFVMAYEYVAKTDPSLLPQVMELFNETARKVCEGQQFDMDFESLADVNIHDYLMMIRLKTAVLIACSLKLGAIIAGAPTEVADKLYDAGIELGLAFQLKDDYLDAFGDTTRFGKTIGGDIAANKKTYLLLKALETARGDQLIRLTNLLTDTETGRDEKITGIIGIYNDLNIPAMVLDQIRHHHTKATGILDTLIGLDYDVSELKSLMEQMLRREN